MKVKTTGQATPIMLKADLMSGSIPSWSPAGDWIAYGQELISPDGKTTRPLGNKGSAHYMFSADGKLVYGIRRDGERNILFSVDIATGVEKVLGDLGKDFLTLHESQSGHPVQPRSGWQELRLRRLKD